MATSGSFEEGKWKDSTLRGLLMGPPLNCRDEGEDPVADLHDYVASLCALLREVYGKTATVEATCGDIMHLTEPCGDVAKQAICERAAILFAMHMEPEVGHAFANADGGSGRRFVRRMRDRVLPLLVPHYVKEMYQYPDWFVLTACALCEMWGGEKWLWDETHRNTAVGHDGDRADGVGAGASSGRVDPNVDERRDAKRDKRSLNQSNEQRLAVRAVGSVGGDAQ